MKEKGFLKDFWENLEEYLCSAALLVMTFVTFMNVFSRKITWFNMSFTQELYGRCPWRSERCRKAPPLMAVGKRKVRCWNYAD